ncbi:MAG TPA: CoB--CoM heterodisulfide reductase iron-sulfur subunit B family protein [Fimbriimonadaceae bacterium]|nr:CoB--CoM heterodisulfide reductase iron-sulfur subunit B family protein [Fimbriimonadaceae bacterium]
MAYLYYPGCSLKTGGRAYEESILAVFKALGEPLNELPDWNCCGATTYMSIDEAKAFTLAARNLALAGKSAGGPCDLVTPCAACFLTLRKAQHAIDEKPDIGRRVKEGLKKVGLPGEWQVRVRHPLDVLVNDLGVDRIAKSVKKPLSGIRVASYYGCQIVRPYESFDDPVEPRTMDQIMEALGATVVDWPLRSRCCGGSLSGTTPDVGLWLPFILLQEAKKKGADVMATACPLCQFNLECNQDQIKARYGDAAQLPVAYFTQLMGLALGLPAQDLGIQRLFVPLPKNVRETEHARA